MNVKRAPLHIVHTESSCGWGGQEIRILTEASGMIARGHRVTLLCAPDAPLFGEARARNLSVEVLPLAKKRWRGVVAMRKWLQQHQPDIINTHSSTDSWLAAVARLGLRRCGPIVRTRHVSVPVAPSMANRWLYGAACKRVVTTGEALRQELIERLNLSPEQVLSVPTGIDMHVFSRAQASPSHDMRAALGLPPDAQVLGMVATLRSWKGHEYLLDAFGQLAARYPQLHVVIAGDGPRKPSIDAKIQTLAARERVHMLGQRTDVPDILSALDVFVLPSFANEGVPQALIQAMAMELPVVTTQVGAIPELVEDGVTGFVVAPKDTSALVQHIDQLLQQNSLRLDMGRRAREVIAARYSLPAMLDNMEHVFYSALQSAPHHRVIAQR